MRVSTSRYAAAVALTLTVGVAAPTKQAHGERNAAWKPSKLVTEAVRRYGWSLVLCWRQDTPKPFHAICGTYTNLSALLDANDVGHRTLTEGIEQLYSQQPKVPGETPAGMLQRILPPVASLGCFGHDKVQGHVLLLGMMEGAAQDRAMDSPLWSVDRNWDPVANIGNCGGGGGSRGGAGGGIPGEDAFGEMMSSGGTLGQTYSAWKGYFDSILKSCGEDNTTGRVGGGGQPKPMQGGNDAAPNPTSGPTPPEATTVTAEAEKRAKAAVDAIVAPLGASVTREGLTWKLGEHTLAVKPQNGSTTGTGLVFTWKGPWDCLVDSQCGLRASGCRMTAERYALFQTMTKGAFAAKCNADVTPMPDAPDVCYGQRKVISAAQLRELMQTACEERQTLMQPGSEGELRTCTSGGGRGIRLRKPVGCEDPRAICGPDMLKSDALQLPKTIQSRIDAVMRARSLSAPR